MGPYLFIALVIVPCAGMAYKIVEIFVLLVLCLIFKEGDTAETLTPPVSAGIIAAGVYLIDAYGVLHRYDLPYS